MTDEWRIEKYLAESDRVLIKPVSWSDGAKLHETLVKRADDAPKIE